MAMAQRLIAREAMPNRSPAVVNTPTPSKVIFMATALDPNRIQIKAVKRALDKGSFWFEMLFSIISRNKFDGVLESPIYCVAAVFQTLGILQVLPLS